MFIYFLGVRYLQNLNMVKVVSHPQWSNVQDAILVFICLFLSSLHPHLASSSLSSFSSRFLFCFHVFRQRPPYTSILNLSTWVLRSPTEIYDIYFLSTLLDSTLVYPLDLPGPTFKKRAPEQHDIYNRSFATRCHLQTCLQRARTPAQGRVVCLHGLPSTRGRGRTQACPQTIVTQSAHHSLPFSYSLPLCARNSLLEPFDSVTGLVARPKK